MPQQKRLDQQFPFPANDTILQPLRLLTRAIEARLLPLETQRVELTESIKSIQEVGLARINDFLLPAIEKVLALTTLGFLSASSSSSVLLTQGETKTFLIPEGPQRDLFHPTEFVDISRVSNLDTYALGRVAGYDPLTGALTVTLDSVTGPIGPWSDWSISATAGTSLAMRHIMDETLAAYNGSLDALSDAQSVAAVIGDPDQFLADLQVIADEAQAAADAANQFDPANYVLTSSLGGEFATRLANYITNSALASILSGYVTTNALSGYASTASLAALTARVATLEAQGFATPAQIRAKAAGYKLDMAGAYNAAQWVQLTDAPTIAMDFNSFENAFAVLGGNRILGTPVNLTPGQTGTLEFVQDASGTQRTLIFAAGYAFAGAAPTMSAGANKRDALSYLGLRDGKCLILPSKGLVVT